MNKEKSKARFRLHWLSWCTLVLLSVCMTVIVVPGIVIPAKRWMLSHGWPCEYMQSDLRSFEPWSLSKTTIKDVITWTRLDAWAVGNQTSGFKLSSLLIDLLVAGVVVAIGTLAVEVWRRRRKGVWFSLFDILVAVGLVAIVTSWYQSHARDHAAETHALTAGDKYFISRTEKSLQAPDWLTRLVGGGSQIQFCEHVTKVSAQTRFDYYASTGEPIDVEPTDSVRALAGFKRVEAIRLDGPLHPELPAALAGLKSLRKLVLNYDNDYMRATPPNIYDSEAAASINHVSDVTMNSGVFFNDSLWELIEPKVRFIQTLQELDQLEQLTTIEVNLGYISHAGWRAIPPMSKLSRISFASREIFIEDLVVLEQFTDLKQVWLAISATKEELQNFERTHPQLELKWDSRSEINSQQVTIRRLKNLRLKEWYSKTGQNFYYGFNEEFDPKKLDVTDFEFTLKELEVVAANVDLASVTSISIDRIDSVQSLNQLVKRCSSLTTLELHAEFPDELVDQLILPEHLSLAFRQGDRTVEEIHGLIEKYQPSDIDVYDSTLSEADYDILEEAWPDIEVFYYDDLPSMYQPEPVPNFDYMGGGFGGGAF